MIEKSRIKNILVIRNDHIGDLILSTPVFRGLKKSFPNAKITVICSKVNKPIIEHNKNVDELIIFEHGKQFLKNFHKYPKILWNLRRKKFDIGIDLRGDFLNVFFLMFMAGVKKRIGSYRSKSSKFFLNKGLKKDFETHETDYVLKLINNCLGLKIKNNVPEIATISSDKKEAEIFIKKNKLKKFICIVPETPHPGKQWPLGKFDKIIKFLNKNYSKHKILMFGTDKEKLNWLKNKNPQTKIIIKPNLRFIYHLFQKSSLVISLDVGPMHIAWVGKSKLLGIILKFSEDSLENIKPLGKNSRYLVERNINKKITVGEVKKEIKRTL